MTMNSPDTAVAVIRAVGETPGFKVDPGPKGSYKLEREAIPEHGVDSASMKLSTQAANRPLANAITRMRRDLGWTMDLHDQLAEIERKHRIAETDPADDIRATLLEAFGVAPAAAPDGAPADGARPRQRRHGKGGTATGSARAKTAAQAAEPAAGLAEAPVQVIEGIGRTQAEMITPERAMDLLVKMAPYQRELNKRKVTDYASAMTRGEWVLNPADPICIDTNGQTCNGQHRLHAIVESMTPQPFMVSYDVDPTTYQVMDRGKRRTTADMLHGAGETSTTALASVAKIAHLWFNVEQEHWKKAPEVTEAQVFAVLEAHPDLRESVKAGRLGKGLKCAPTAAMFVHYLISRKCGGPERVTAWYRAMENMDLERGTPGHTLGLFFLKANNQRRTNLPPGRSRRELDMYLLVQAWNNACRGVEMRSVSWKSDFMIANPIAPTTKAKLPPIAE